MQDTHDILVSYDGCRIEKQLKGLIDEARERIHGFLSGAIEEYEKNLEA